MHIIESTPDDLEAIERVHRLAFDREDESRLVRELLRDPTAQPSLSLLAFMHEHPVGHVLFTKVSLDGAAREVPCAILAPLAVVPEHQQRGVGKALIEHGARLLAGRGVKLVFVLGDPRYYTRRGFGPASAGGLHAPYPIEPDEAWMVRPLEAGLLGQVRGTVRCAASLARPEYWRE